ncbi:hypothetical protein FHS51_004288, partial [Sphingobium wenxiniae]|uniref:toprim domain-containing protein n=1 Tax=Sphingobium wenxiniae (strain DSM 21828 / CGMCC 1.7748 / JZ-1) TaxID=595605 RepID=UPI00183E7CD0
GRWSATVLVESIKRSVFVLQPGQNRSFGPTGPTGDVLRLAEGFEEAVSVTQLSDGKFKVWGAGGIRRYGLIAIPERIRKIVIYSQHGQEAAQAIEDARDHLTANDRELKIILPPAPAPMDWNDILQERARC